MISSSDMKKSNVPALPFVGLACIIVAICGGGEFWGMKFPELLSTRRQLLLAALGVVLVVATSMSQILTKRWRWPLAMLFSMVLIIWSTSKQIQGTWYLSKIYEEDRQKYDPLKESPTTFTYELSQLCCVVFGHSQSNPASHTILLGISGTGGLGWVRRVTPKPDGSDCVVYVRCDVRVRDADHFNVDATASGADSDRCGQPRYQYLEFTRSGK
jgi:hypothetical protein